MNSVKKKRLAEAWRTNCLLHRLSWKTRDTAGPRILFALALASGPASPRLASPRHRALFSRFFHVAAIPRTFLFPQEPRISTARSRLEFFRTGFDLIGFRTCAYFVVKGERLNGLRLKVKYPPGWYFWNDSEGISFEKMYEKNRYYRLKASHDGGIWPTFLISVNYSYSDVN